MHIVQMSKDVGPVRAYMRPSA